MEFCERWWHCNQELLAVEEHCEQLHSFADKQRPWWAFKISGRKTIENTECDRNLTSAYNELSQLYAKFDDEVLHCLKDISGSALQQNTECRIIAEGADFLSKSDDSIENCWSQIHQIHAKCNMLKVCCTPASWCLKEVGRRAVGKAVDDSEDFINQKRLLCKQDQIWNVTSKQETVEAEESLDERPVTAPQQSFLTSGQNEGRHHEQLSNDSGILTTIPIILSSLKDGKMLRKAEFEREASLCEAYMDCQQNLLDFSDACAIASGRVQSGAQYDYSSFYQLLEPVDDLDRSCRQRENGRQIALNIARDQVSGYIRWCIRSQAPNALADSRHISHSCFMTNTSYYGRVIRLRKQPIQADNCTSHVQNFNNICQRLKKCCIPAKLCEQAEEFKEAMATYIDLMTDLKAFMNRCYHNALSGNLSKNSNLKRNIYLKLLP